MSKPRYIPKKKTSKLPTFLVHWIETGEEPSTDQPDDWFDFILMNENRLRSAWEIARGEIVRQWVRQLPCSRPYAWWRYEAPQKRKKFVTDGQLYYESQAAYLKRHDLLGDGEKRHLAKTEEKLSPVPQAIRYRR